MGRRWIVVGLILFGCAAVYLSVCHVDVVERSVSPATGKPVLAEWGDSNYAFEAGVTTLADIQDAFGEADEQLDDGLTYLWRSTYIDTFRIYRRWLYRRKLIAGHETFIPYEIAVTFDENGVMTTWRRQVPIMAVARTGD